MAERSGDYPTRGNPNGMEFIGNRWVFTGGSGFRVVFDGTDGDGGDWAVLSYDGPHTRLVPGGRGLTEDEAHAMAARLASR